jgi:phenylacetate-CoA ligase
VLNRFAALSGEYRIVLDHPPPYDVLPVEVELAEGQGGEVGLAASVEAAIKAELGATARVTVLPPRSLPRTEGKTRRVRRTYP